MASGRLNGDCLKRRSWNSINVARSDSQLLGDSIERLGPLVLQITDSSKESNDETFLPGFASGVVPSATVTVKNATGVEYTTQTSDQGTFVVPKPQYFTWK